MNAVEKKIKYSNPKQGMDLARARRAVVLEQILPTISIDAIRLDDWQHKKSVDLNLADARDSRDWRRIRLGGWWGGNRLDFWFRRKIILPDLLIGKSLILRLRPGSEGLVYLDGREECGIDPFHPNVFFKGTRAEHEILMGMHSGWNHPRWGYPHGWNAGVVQFKQADLGVFSADAWRCSLLLTNLGNIIDGAGLGADKVSELTTVFDEAIRKIAMQRPGSADYYRSLPGALDYLEKTLYRHRLALGRGVTHLVGHSHLDVVYLWPWPQTVHKASRTFASMLGLMRRYREFRFTQSSAVLYDFMRERFPRLFRQIKARHAAGQWEVVGGMWLESDCNLPSGESLVRQFLYGQRFFRREFGCTCTVCWLPDVFGFNANLPQIMARAGIRYFATAKLSLNWRFRLPHDVFRWRAPDGSEVLAASLQTGYGGNLTPSEMSAARGKYLPAPEIDAIPLCYGYSDGGGGVTDAMVECGRILTRITPPGNVRFSGLGDYFKTIERVAGRLTTWRDELYLEAHQGTFTTEARTKRGNRRCEQAMRRAEIVSTAAFLAGLSYPRSILERCWKKLLLNQFHDAITGSCVTEATAHALAHYKEIMADCSVIFRRSLDAVLNPPRRAQAGAEFTVLNFTSDRLTGLARMPAIKGVRALADPQGNRVPVQQSGDGKSMLFVAADLPQIGYRTYSAVSSGAVERLPFEPVQGDLTGRIENAYYTCRLNRAGEITAYYFKPAGRRLVDARQPANNFQFFEDIDKPYDGWDLYDDYEKKRLSQPAVTGFHLVEKGPLRVIYAVARRFQSSIIRQQICFYAHTARIDFETEVDWREKHVLFKTAFPVRINARSATYEIPYAVISRPTRPNTAYDSSRFEVPAQRWADLSETRCGVSLMNDCKYGYDIKGRVMRLTLLRASTMPNPEADQGRQVFTYSLFAHLSDWRRGGTLAEARELNEPLEVVRAGAAQPEFCLLHTDAPNVTIENIKLCEDNDDLVLRLVETHGLKTAAHIQCGFPVSRVFETNLLEDNLKLLPARAGRISFGIGPFEIKTLRLQVGRKKDRRK